MAVVITYSLNCCAYNSFKIFSFVLLPNGNRLRPTNFIYNINGSKHGRLYLITINLTLVPMEISSQKKKKM